MISTGQYAEAEALLSKGIERGRGAKVLLAQDPDAVDMTQLNAYRFRASARYELDDIDGALADHTAAIELCPTLARLWVERGETYYLEARLDEALVDFDQGLTCDPESIKGLLYRAYCRREAGDAEGAEADLTTLIGIAPEVGLVYLDRARLRHQRGELELALADYDKHLELEPDSAEGLAWRGQLYIDTQRYEQAVADLARALEVWPGQAEGKEGVEESLKNLRAFLSKR